MLVKKQTHGYSSYRKYVQGKGFLDSLKSIGSYVAQNKDLIAKPLLGAVGNLAAAGLKEGGKALLSHIIKKNNKSKSQVTNYVDPQLDGKGNVILQSIMNGGPGVIGSGIKRF